MEKEKKEGNKTISDILGNTKKESPKTESPKKETLKLEVSKPIKKPYLMPVIIIASIIIVAVILGILLFLIYNNLYSRGSNISFSEPIKSVSLSNNLNSLNIGLKPQNLTTNQTNAKVKIILNNINGTIYNYLTGKTFSELNYSIQINLTDIAGLDNFKKISNISLVFVQAVSTPPTNNTPNSSRRNPPSNDSTTPPPSDDPNDCTNGAWQNGTYRCNAGVREIKQTRTLCVSGSTEEQWTSIPCLAGYSCYAGEGAPTDKCINSTLNCFASDNTTNSSINGFVNITNQIFNDSCSLDNKTLTQYSCFYNGTNFIARNQTLNCTFSCKDGACITCADNDSDGYSSQGDLCGQIDCNDTNSNINPGKVEICGNNIDENCDTIAQSCNDLQSGLIAHWKFNDSLSDGIATDETGINNAICTSCPIFNDTGGLNNSGAYEFDGITNSLTIIPANVLNNNTYSISLWINPEATTSKGTIIYSNADANITLNLGFDGDGNSLYLRNDYGVYFVSSLNIIDLNTWNNLILIYDNPNRQAKLYLNGELIITKTNLNQTSSPTQTTVGSKSDQLYFKGSMAEVRIYNRTLTADEISSLSTEFSQGELTSLSLWQNIINWFKRVF